MIPSPDGWKPYLFAPYSTTRVLPSASVYLFNGIIKLFYHNNIIDS